MQLNRRLFLVSSAASLAIAKQQWAWGAEADLQWADVRDWGVEGKAFQDTESWYDRLPRRAKGVVNDSVWNLSRHSAGMMVRFQTDSSEIHVDYQVTSVNLSMPHMPATGVSGLDLYGQDEEGKWKWISVVAPTAQKISKPIVTGLEAAMRNYAVYLPLYNGTEYLKIGVPKSAAFRTIEPRKEKPLVFYGTSITHGACASRPGMPHPSILGRRLDCPVINLGFSGSGRMDLEVGKFLTEIDAAAFIIDCLPNMEAGEVTAKTQPLVKQLRAARPQVPIVLVEDRSYSGSWAIPSQHQRNTSSRVALKEQFTQLQNAGVDQLFYIDGESLLGQDREDTTDGSHPSDLGFYRHADAFEPVLRKVLNRS